MAGRGSGEGRVGGIGEERQPERALGDRAAGRRERLVDGRGNLLHRVAELLLDEGLRSCAQGAAREAQDPGLADVHGRGLDEPGDAVGLTHHRVEPQRAHVEPDARAVGGGTGVGADVGVRRLELGLHHRVLDQAELGGRARRVGDGQRGPPTGGQLGTDPGHVDAVGLELGGADAGVAQRGRSERGHRLEQRGVVGRGSRIRRGRDRDQGDEKERRKEGDESPGRRHRDNLTLTTRRWRPLRCCPKACWSATPRARPGRKRRGA